MGTPLYGDGHPLICTAACHCMQGIVLHAYVRLHTFEHMPLTHACTRDAMCNMWRR